MTEEIKTIRFALSPRDLGYRSETVYLRLVRKEDGWIIRTWKIDRSPYLTTIRTALSTVAHYAMNLTPRQVADIVEKHLGYRPRVKVKIYDLANTALEPIELILTPEEAEEVTKKARDNPRIQTSTLYEYRDENETVWLPVVPLVVKCLLTGIRLSPRGLFPRYRIPGWVVDVCLRYGGNTALILYIWWICGLAPERERIFVYDNLYRLSKIYGVTDRETLERTYRKIFIELYRRKRAPSGIYWYRQLYDMIISRGIFNAFYLEPRRELLDIIGKMLQNTPKGPPRPEEEEVMRETPTQPAREKTTKKTETVKIARPLLF